VKIHRGAAMRKMRANVGRPRQDGRRGQAQAIVSLGSYMCIGAFCVGRALLSDRIPAGCGP
jgi:hypothetical protein